MSRTKLRVADSPFTLAFLGAATFCAALLWYSIRQADAAPSLPNWDWSVHPDTLLIYYKPPVKGCACSDDVKSIAAQAKARGLDVMLIASSASETADLNDIPADGRLRGPQYHVPARSSAASGTVLLRVRHERVTRRVFGTNLPVNFFEE